MASWQKPCSSRSAPGTELRRRAPLLLGAIAFVAAGCGHAGDHAPADQPQARPQTGPVATPGNGPDAPSLSAADALCVPAATGALRARLQGSIDAEIDWGEDAVHCLGGVRPQGDGLRLLYKGSVPDAGPLLVVLGLRPLRPGESARNVPVNLTVVREGTGHFFATQGEDKCALDAVSQVPLESDPRLYRLEGRGYCTQPARAVGGDGAVLLSRFDVVAIIPAAQ